MSAEEDTAMEDAADVSPDTPVVKKTDIQSVVMHPLVLLSAADHYHRVARGTRKRVVGVLLGSIYAGKVDISNSFAVPFEEDPKNPVRKVLLYRVGWFLTLFVYLVLLFGRPSFIWTTTTSRTCI